MDNVCFIISIRQRICQSGVPLNIEKTYTNISANTPIFLSNGYTLTLNRATNNDINLNFVNTAFNLNFTFTVNDSTTTVFDLPIEGGTYRLAIFVSMRCCCSCG